MWSKISISFSFLQEQSYTFVTLGRKNDDLTEPEQMRIIQLFEKQTVQ